MNVRPYGEAAVLVETGEHSPALLRGLIAGRSGIGDVVPGARTLLVEYDPRAWTAAMVVETLQGSVEEARRDVATVQIPVRYDGPDLDDVAELTGLTVDEVVTRHSAATYSVAFGGFAPGFAYLTGLDPALHVARLAEPRTSVPAGAVAIAGEYSAVYPRSTPGGWHLLGSTETSLWDIDAEPPALLTPGATVRFVST